MISRDEITLFALNASREFGERISHHLEVPLSDHEEREFEDGEHKARPLVNVRGRDVFVIQSLHGDDVQSPNDKLCRLLFFVGALRDASAGRVTTIIPYLAYARKDRKTKSRDPVTMKYVAALLEAVGTNHVVTLDVHNLAAFQNAFRCATDHLEAKKLFVDYFADKLRGEGVVVVSPDVGGVKRAELFREALGEAMEQDVPAAFVEKRRSAGVVSGDAMVGDVKNRVVVLIDDLISTGTTLARAAQTCRNAGSGKVFAAASHGLFVAGANDALASAAIEKIVTTNTVPHFRLRPDLAAKKLVVLDASTLFGEAIARIHAGGSIVDLLET
jgi:ribose-phosphate pyrophosphokinase